MVGLQGQLEQLGVPRSYARQLVEHTHQLEAASNSREVRMIRNVCRERFHTRVFCAFPQRSCGVAGSTVQWGAADDADV